MWGGGEERSLLASRSFPIHRGTLAQLTGDEILRKIVTGEVPLYDGILALVDRKTGFFGPNEGYHHDYKETLRIDPQSVGELAREILGFSNSGGGILIIGVADDKSVVGHGPVDLKMVRDSLGPYLGTRVDFYSEEVSVHSLGRTHSLNCLQRTPTSNHLSEPLKKRHRTSTDCS
jgi:Putative DNA-binding domain